MTATPQTADWIDSRVEELMPVLMQLLNAPFVEFGKGLRARLPSARGVYAISRKDARPGEYLRAGKTDKSLKQRIYQNHWMGDQDGNLRKQLVKGGDCVSFQATQGWICENCRLQFLVIEDNRTRTLAEHFIIAVLKPKYVDEGRRESALEEA